MKEKKNWGKLFSKLLVLFTCLAIPTMFIITLIVAPAASMDANITIELFEKADYDDVYRKDRERDEMCQYPECTKHSVYKFYSWLDESREKDKVDVDVENKANFTIITMPEQAVKEFENHDRETVYGVSYVGGGTFLVTEDNVMTTEKVRIKDGVVYSTVIEGYYCEEHKDIALTTIKEEIKDWYVADNFWYFWAHTIGAWGYAIIAAISAVLVFVSYKVRQKFD